MIRHTKILFYCDGPQVIKARDVEAKDYVGVDDRTKEITDLTMRAQSGTRTCR